MLATSHDPPPDPPARYSSRHPGRRCRPPGRHRPEGAPGPLGLDVNDGPQLDNLYVVDTSCFPSIGAVNPALTAMANALRVGDHLLDRLGAR